MADDRDWGGSDYSRLYHSTMRDPKFVKVYQDDRAWALYTRLLMSADAAWPTPSILPRAAGKYAVGVLVSAGLIQLTGDIVTIPALAKERAHRYGGGKGRPRFPSDKPPTPEPNRSEVGAESEPSGVSSEVVRNEPESHVRGRNSASTSDSLLSSETEDRARDDEPEWPVLSYLASVGAYVQPTGNGYHRDLIALVERQGAIPVLSTMKRLHASGQKTARQLIYGATNALEPIQSGKAGPAPKGHHGNAEEARRAFGE